VFPLLFFFNSIFFPKLDLIIFFNYILITKTFFFLIDLFFSLFLKKFKNKKIKGEMVKNYKMTRNQPNHFENIFYLESCYFFYFFNFFEIMFKTRIKTSLGVIFAWDCYCVFFPWFGDFF